MTIKEAMAAIKKLAGETESCQLKFEIWHYRSDPTHCLPQYELTVFRGPQILKGNGSNLDDAMTELLTRFSETPPDLSEVQKHVDGMLPF